MCSYNYLLYNPPVNEENYNIFIFFKNNKQTAIVFPYGLNLPALTFKIFKKKYYKIFIVTMLIKKY
jgi:hypothetical protein